MNEIHSLPGATPAVPAAAPALTAAPTPASPDPLAALRAATAERHELLDSGLPIGQPDATLRDYGAHLAMLRAWLAPLHDWLGGFTDGPDGDTAPRLALIDADLADLADLAGPGRAASGEAGAPASLPASTGASASGSAPAWPLQASAAYRWGVYYVIEGSQLGGAVLYARLRERLAPHPLRYLKGRDAGPGPGWRAFMTALRANVRTEAEIVDACAGACAAFDAILALRGHTGAR